MENEAIQFIKKFFEGIGAKTYVQDELLIVDNVPAHFQKFYGRAAPYKFSENIKDREDVEFVEKGSYTLKAIRSYLEESGQTTLLKIDFNCNPEEEIKKQIKPLNARLYTFKEKKRHNIFFRFTFHTAFQYLNEKEKVINKIYVHEGKVVQGDLDNYTVVEGSTRDISIPNMKDAYFVAKEEVRHILQDKTQEITQVLSQRLDKEIQRIERHFGAEDTEIHTNLKKAVQKLNELADEVDDEKVQRQKRVLQKLKKRLNPEERLNDKEREIGIEKTRHGLNVNTKLFNTTVIYHPVFTYNAEIRNEQGQGIVELAYDPLTQTVANINCNTCAKETKEIALCKNKHIVCSSCITICQSCQEHHCKDCVTLTCEKCNNKICNNCKTRCSSCARLMCKTHTKKDKISGKVYCNDCLVRCERCSSLKIESLFKFSKKTGAKICAECFRKEMQQVVMDNLP